MKIQVNFNHRPSHFYLITGGRLTAFVALHRAPLLIVCIYSILNCFFYKKKYSKGEVRKKFNFYKRKYGGRGGGAGGFDGDEVEGKEHDWGWGRGGSTL